jgi:hypothetical protein
MIRRHCTSFGSSKLSQRISVVRRSQFVRDSFCLGKILFLFLGLPVISLVWYYHTYFQWTHREDPYSGLTYVKECTEPQANAFRKKTVASICVPTLQCIDRVVKLRRQTQKGTFRPPGMEEELQAVRNRLKEIMTEARLRRIPMVFKNEYSKNLAALVDCFYAINVLEDSFDQETLAAREKLYKQSIKSTAKARKQCQQARDYFTSDTCLERSDGSYLGVTTLFTRQHKLLGKSFQLFPFPPDVGRFLSVYGSVSSVALRYGLQHLREL